MSEFFDNLTREGAAQLWVRVSERLEANDYSIGAAMLEVLEIKRPEGITKEELDAKIFAIGFELIGRDDC